MNWKQFLKPDKIKIVIFPIMFLIFFLAFFMESLYTIPSSYVKAAACTTIECENQRNTQIANAISADKASMRMNFYDVELLIITPFYYLPLRYSDWIGVSSWIGINWWTTVLELVYCYLITCVIIWSYSKIRGKNK